MGALRKESRGVLSIRSVLGDLGGLDLNGVGVQLDGIIALVCVQLYRHLPPPPKWNPSVSFTGPQIETPCLECISFLFLVVVCRKMS